MKKIAFMLLTFLMLISFSTSAYAGWYMDPDFHKKIREEGYADGTIISMLVLVISGTVLSILFFRKDIKRKLQNQK